MMEQLALSRPTRRVDASRLSDRQHKILLLPAAHGVRYVTPSLVAQKLGYADGGQALRRLVERGLMRRVGRGEYALVKVNERLIRQA